MNIYLILSLVNLIGSFFSAYNDQKFLMVINIFLFVYFLARGFGAI